MAINYVDFKQVKNSQGLRLVVMPGLPSPWSEAAKGILQVKGISYQAIYLDHKNKEMASWAKTQSAPVAVFDQEEPLDNWLDILMLAEKLKPDLSLLSENPDEKKQILDLSQAICGENGLGWLRRLDSIDKGLKGQAGGFITPIAQYLGAKYGYQQADAISYVPRMIQLLQSLSELLRAQNSKGSHYLIGTRLSAVDIYLATFMAYFSPLPESQCDMQAEMRRVFSTLSPELENALDNILLKHRDFIYQQHLDLPLSL